MEKKKGKKKKSFRDNKGRLVILCNDLEEMPRPSVDQVTRNAVLIFMNTGIWPNRSRP